MFSMCMQFERGEALDNITRDVKKALEEECDEEGLKALPKTVDTVRKKVTPSISDLYPKKMIHVCIKTQICICVVFQF